MANNRKNLITLLKIIFSVLLIYFIFNKIPFKDVWAVLKTSNPWLLTIALLFLLLSKVFKALRLNLYFHQLNIPITQKSNFKLYLLGMFYNLFLPGGIGGDAYKGYVIRDKFEVNTKSVVTVFLLDRLSGLLVIVNYTCILALLLKNEVLQPYNYLFILVILLSLFVFWFINKKYFSFVYPVFWKSIGYSLVVQLVQLLSVVFIIKSLYVKGNMIAYLFIFFISSMVSVLPVTIGGFGSRELVFFYGAEWLKLDQSTSLSISILFFFLTAILSLTGIYYHFKKPELKLEST